jgi:hypothetical protein
MRWRSSSAGVSRHSATAFADLLHALKLQLIAQHFSVVKDDENHQPITSTSIPVCPRKEGEEMRRRV